MKEIMTVEELSSYLRVNSRTIYRLLERNEIPSIKVGRQWRFDKADIDKWLRKKCIVNRAKMLVVDDDESILSLFADLLGESRHELFTTVSPSQGLDIVRKEDLDLVFLDLMLPGTDGVEMFRQIRSMKPELPVIVITGYPDSELMSQALEIGPFSIIKKPFTGTDIMTAIDNYMRFGK